MKKERIHEALFLVRPCRWGEFFFFRFNYCSNRTSVGYEILVDDSHVYHFYH